MKRRRRRRTRYSTNDARRDACAMPKLSPPTVSPPKFITNVLFFKTIKLPLHFIVNYEGSRRWH